MKSITHLYILVALVFSMGVSRSQPVRSLQIDTSNGLAVTGYTTVGGATIRLPKSQPLFSVEIKDRVCSSVAESVKKDRDGMGVQFPYDIVARLAVEDGFS